MRELSRMSEIVVGHVIVLFNEILHVSTLVIFVTRICDKSRTRRRHLQTRCSSCRQSRETV